MNYIFFLVLAVVLSNLVTLAIVARRSVTENYIGEGWAGVFIASLVAVVATIITLCNTTNWR